MKKSIVITCFIMFWVALSARAEVDPLAESEMEALLSAIRSMDEGEHEVAITLLDGMLEKHPDNYMIAYELGYAYYLAEDYNKSIEIYRKLIDHPDASELVYGQLGNCLDNAGRYEEAIEVYQKGLERFPKTGSLWTNMGIAQMGQKEYLKALESFESSIEVDPLYDAGYYWAAKSYANTNMPMWALIYAETFNILSQRSDRKEEMAKLILDILKEKITFNGKKISVKLASGVIVDADPTKPPFEHTFEITCGIGAMAILYGWTYETVSDLRSKALTAFTNIITPTNRMALQKFQKAILDAGHWDAYNYIIMQYAFPEESAKWIEQPENQEKLNNFTDFIRKYDEPIIDPDHTVSSRLLK